MRPMCNLACVAAGSNAITFKQFCEALKGFLIPHTEQAARDLFSELDIDGDGTCDYCEFLKGVMQTDTRVKLSLGRTRDYRHDVGMRVIMRAVFIMAMSYCIARLGE